MLMNVITNDTALWTGFRASTTPAAEITANTAKMSKTNASADITLRYLLALPASLNPGMDTAKTDPAR
jgi:hypothetical protein